MYDDKGLTPSTNRRIAMTIDAGHWGMVVGRVAEHARKLHPKDVVAQRRLKNYLLAISANEKPVNEFWDRVPRPSLLKRFLELFK